MDKKRPASNAAVLALMHELGFSDGFAKGIVYLLDTDYLSDHMLRFLRNARPHSQNTVADQLVAITEERDRYVRKHIDEHIMAQGILYKLYAEGFGTDVEET